MRKAARIAVGAMALLGLLAGAALAVPSAQVTLSIPAERVQTDVTLAGSPGAGDLPTQKMSVTVTDTIAGTASPATITAFAAGEVVFAWGRSCTPGSCPSFRVTAGADVSTHGGVHYRTLKDVVWSAPNWSPRTPIVAVLPGASGNAAPGTVTVFGTGLTDLAVRNTDAVIGGSSRDTHMISESDFAAVEKAVVTEAIQDANAAMRAKAVGMGYALTGPLSLTETSSDSVGDETESFTVTVSVAMAGVGFSDRVARFRLRQAVMARVGPDRQLTRDSIQTDYKIDSVTTDGEVHVSGNATAFVIPRISTASLQRGVAGLSLTQARDMLTRAVPGAKASIQMWPGGVQVLPVVPGRIAIRVEVLPAP